MFPLSIPATPIATALAALVTIGCVYYAAVIVAAWRFRNRKPSPASGERPGISILKPVRGCDPDFLDCIRSHAGQDYPELEIIFGVADSNDPAVGPIERLIREFPERRIELVICGPAPGGNPKAATLEQIESRAHYGVILVSDSDVAIAPDYLRHAAGELSQPKVGMVCSLYEARPGATLPSRLEAALITAEFQGQVLLARLIQGIRFGLGAAMLFRREDLGRIGGFQALTPYIGDDYELGRRIAGLGHGVALSNSVVRTSLGAGSFRNVWRHQLRWSRTIRAARPAGHAGLLFTHGTVWSVLLLAVAGGTPAFSALALGGLCLRILAAWQVAGRTLRSQSALVHTLLAIPGDLLGFAVWLASFFGRRVFWRGRWLRLGRSGRIVEVGVEDKPQRDRQNSAPVSE